MKTIEEKNRMIAEFMGFVKDDENLYLIDDYRLRGESEYQATYVSEMEFHTSWDWLMPVVEEIDHLEYESERLDNIDEAIKTRQIGSVHQAVVEFIEWHNENK